MSRNRLLIIAIWCILWLVFNADHSLENQESEGNRNENEDDEYEYYDDDDDDDEGDEDEEGQEHEIERSQRVYSDEGIDIEDSKDVVDWRSKKYEIKKFNAHGIYGKCNKENTRNRTQIVLAAGGYILMFSPQADPYSCFYFFAYVKGCGGKTCSAAFRATSSHQLKCLWTKNKLWFWLFLRKTVVPNARQRLYLHTWGTQKKLYKIPHLHDGGLPPMPSNVEVKVGHGFVWVYIFHPNFRNKEERRVLGYRVSLMDLEVGPVWDVITFVEDVEYRCEFPELRPIHPCLRWRHEHCICVLITEPVLWTNNDSSISESTNKFIKVESFYIPQPMELRWYSRPFIVQMYDVSGIGSLSNPYGPMFGYGNSTHATTRHFERGYLDILWAILLGFALMFLVAGLPLVLYMAWRAGHREAETVWRDWAESPGNVGVGLGGDAIAWQGKPPWKYRTV